MKTSRPHRKDPGARPYKSTGVVAHATNGDFKVLRLVLLYDGAPKHTVCCEGNAVAHFFDEDLAKEYATWKNQKP